MRVDEPTMSATLLEEFGLPEVLRTKRVPVPNPGPGQVLVRTAASSLNASDITHRQGPGFIGSTKRILGWDVSGVVESIGVGVTVHSPGNQVFGLLPYPGGHGANAEFVLAPARALIPVPYGLDLRHAAALPLAGLTAWQALVETARITPGQRVLIHGGAGGVGHLAIQIAKARGCFVATTVRKSQMDFAEDCGADLIIDFEESDFTVTPERFDAILDPIGGNYPERSAKILNEGGCIVSLALRKTRPMHSEGLPAGARHSMMLVEADRAGMLELSELIMKGQLVAHIAQTFPLQNLVEAHRSFEQGNIQGKILVTC